MAPRTRNWKAMELPDFSGRSYHLAVTGEVEVTGGNKTPHLKLHTPQGFNPRILLLDLTISTDSEGGIDVMMWKAVSYRQSTSGRQFDEVDILFDGAVIERVNVQHPKTAAKAGARKKSAAKTARKSVKKAAGKAKTVKKTAQKARKKTKKTKKAARKKRL